MLRKMFVRLSVFPKYHCRMLKRWEEQPSEGMETNGRWLGVMIESGTSLHKPEVFPRVKCVRAVRSWSRAVFGESG